ncbi:hypothetical protein CO611_06055 [Lysobacteraceae bacterium NML03-0222]|nr:hypothetical protein CO611_06055 [Xanthomonadaceae bacterium NML03-0222]
MSESPEAQSFIEAWQRSLPEWRIARVFVPEPQRALAEQWFALFAALTEMAGLEPTPAAAKLAWWQEELRAWGKGARRHPLGQGLARNALPWDALAATLPAMLNPADDAGLQQLAAALADIEQALFAENTEGRGRLYHDLLLILGQTPPKATGGTRPRRVLSALARARQQRGGALSAWQTLCCSWQAARAGNTP